MEKESGVAGVLASEKPTSKVEPFLKVLFDSTEITNSATPDS